MSLSNFVDLVKITATTIGTGPFGLGAPLPGFQGLSALVDGRQYSYSVQQAGLFEFGKGTYSAGTLSLSRSPEGSSSGTATVPFTAGAVVTFTLLASDLMAIATATGAAGGVTSVDVDGGTTGMAFLNGPIINSGTLVMTGILDPSAGGTGQNSIEDARAALGVYRSFGSRYALIQDSEVLLGYLTLEPLTLAANLADWGVRALGTPPIAPMVFNVQDDGVTVGTITIAPTTGAVTRTTVGGVAINIATDRLITLVAPANAASIGPALILAVTGKGGIQ
jgi:hypothetical protein